MTEIDKEMIATWIGDLVIVKTFLGLKFQAAVMKKIAKLKNTTYIQLLSQIIISISSNQ